MTKYHWGSIIIILAIGYVLGIYFPGPGASLRAKIGA